ncbi:MAG TPA: hypothetical protein RMF84_19465 [Polyangiaceae bacterium LLY-WYZ-14_1]|jgi:hypothetical protein|nr:hypothetical protein [Polyangiaceae bacterium LLY-WYZ-14_1]
MRERRTYRCFLALGLLSALATPGLLAGCEAPGVGAPCEPESVPQGGFDAQERYLETSSVQCRTRVCLVYELDGDPREICGEGGDDNCVTPEELDRVFCTCRCDAPTGDARECECPDGFSCEQVLDENVGGDGIAGGYCVRNRLLENNETAGDS